MEHAVAVALQHFGVDVEAGVAELRDLLRQQLHTIHRIAKDDGLVNLQLQQEWWLSQALSFPRHLLVIYPFTFSPNQEPS